MRETSGGQLNLSAVLRGEKKKTQRKIKPKGVNGKDQNRTKQKNAQNVKLKELKV